MTHLEPKKVKKTSLVKVVSGLLLMGTMVSCGLITWKSFNYARNNALLNHIYLDSAVPVVRVTEFSRVRTSSNSIPYKKPFTSSSRFISSAPFAALSGSWWHDTNNQLKRLQKANSLESITVVSPPLQKLSLMKRIASSMKGRTLSIQGAFKSRALITETPLNLDSSDSPQLTGLSEIPDNSLTSNNSITSDNLITSKKKVKKVSVRSRSKLKTEDEVFIQSDKFSRGRYKRYSKIYKGRKYYFAVLEENINGKTVITFNAFGSSGDESEVKNFEKHIKRHLIDKNQRINKEAIVIKKPRDFDHSLRIFLGKCVNMRTVGKPHDFGVGSPIFKFTNSDKNNAPVNDLTFNYNDKQSLLDLVKSTSDSEIKYTEKQLHQLANNPGTNQVWSANTCKDMRLQQKKDIISGMRDAANLQCVRIEKHFIMRNSIESKDSIILAHSNGIIKTMEYDTMLIRDREVKASRGINETIEQLQHIESLVKTVDSFLSSAFFHTKKSSSHYTQTLVNRYLNARKTLIEFAIEKMDILLGKLFDTQVQIYQINKIKFRFKDNQVK
jgi:hypothetical protein